jgi:DNA polymerase III epsilon subunit-like protein
MRALLLDCETTGLLINRTVQDALLPRIVEFHGSLIHFGSKGEIEVERELDTLVRPAGTIDELSKATEVTGITNAMVRDAPSINIVMPRIQKLIEEAPLVIAHNASFDREVIDVEAARLDIVIKWPRVLCSIEQTMHVRGFRMSLSDLHEHLLGEKFVGAHRARADVAALARCVAEMIKQEML